MVNMRRPPLIMRDLAGVGFRSRILPGFLLVPDFAFFAIATSLRSSYRGDARVHDTRRDSAVD
jgi:hypothetical protein